MCTNLHFPANLLAFTKEILMKNVIFMCIVKTNNFKLIESLFADDVLIEAFA